MYMCVRSIDYASFYDFSIRFWHCSNRVELLVFHFITLAGILCNHISTRLILQCVFHKSFTWDSFQFNTYIENIQVGLFLHISVKHKSAQTFHIYTLLCSKGLNMWFMIFMDTMMKVTFAMYLVQLPFDHFLDFYYHNYE